MNHFDSADWTDYARNLVDTDRRAAIADLVVPRLGGGDAPAASEPEPEVVEPETESTAVPSSGRTPPTPAPGALDAAAPQPVPEAPKDRTAAEPEQLRAVEDWARAWSDQRVDDCLAVYSPLFTPEDGLDRRVWERDRRARTLEPRWIRVGLAFVELEETGPETSRVRFVQAYDSDSYSDVVRKVLVLERRGADWRILREIVGP